LHYKQTAFLKRLSFLAIFPRVFVPTQGLGIKAKLHPAILIRLLSINSCQLRIKERTLEASINPLKLTEV